MALTVNTTIDLQEANGSLSYCYLYEPLRVSITESDNTATKIYIELEVLETSNITSQVETIPAYGEFDINSGNSLTVDLMKLAQQHYDANIYKFAVTADFNSAQAAHSVVSKYIYKFKITSDVTTTSKNVIKLPIIGGRRFQDLGYEVDDAVNLTEAQALGVNLINVWKDYPMITQVLGDATPAGNSYRPSVEMTNALSGTKPCGGFLIWKSRLGGWMYWGFKSKTESQAKKYTGAIQVGLYEALSGEAYIPTDYTSIETTYTVQLKDFGLSSDELKAVQGIIASPAVYLMREPNSYLELMRVTSANAPVSNLANGGDFSVSLKSISQSNHKTR